MSTDAEGLRKQPDVEHAGPLSAGAKAAEEMRRLADRLMDVARQEGIHPGSLAWEWVQEAQRVQYRIADSIEESHAQIDTLHSTTRIDVAKSAAARRELEQTQAEMQAMITQLTGRRAGTETRPGGAPDTPGKRPGVLGRWRHLITPQRAVLVALFVAMPVGFGFYVGHVRAEVAFAALLVTRMMECARAPSIDQDTGKAYCRLEALVGP